MAWLIYCMSTTCAETIWDLTGSYLPYCTCTNFSLFPCPFHRSDMSNHFLAAEAVPIKHSVHDDGMHLYRIIPNYRENIERWTRLSVRPCNCLRHYSTELKRPHFHSCMHGLASLLIIVGHELSAQMCSLSPPPISSLLIGTNSSPWPSIQLTYCMLFSKYLYEIYPSSIEHNACLFISSSL